MIKIVKSITFLILCSLLLASCSVIRLPENGAMQASAVATSATLANGMVTGAKDGINELEEELAALELEYQELLKQMEVERQAASSQLDQLRDEADQLEIAYEVIRAERALLAKEFQAYRNEIEAHVTNQEGTEAARETRSTPPLYTEVSYDDLIEGELEFYLKQVSVIGVVNSITQGENLDSCMLLADESSQSYIKLEIPSSVLSGIILQANDRIQIYGSSYGLVNVKLPDGDQHLIPGISVDLIKILH